MCRAARDPIESLMKKLILALIVLAVLCVVGGVVFLGTWDIPAPTQPVEKKISNDRFER
jgi:hypothetical protein